MEFPKFLAFTGAFALAACSPTAGEDESSTPAQDELPLTEQSFTIPAPYNDIDFGRSVALDGDTLVVSSRNVAIDKDVASGAMFTYTRVGSDWVPDEVPVTPPEPVDLEYYANAIALSTGRAAVASGAFTAGETVWILPRTTGAWSEPEAALTIDSAPALDPELDPTEDPQFGSSLALDDSTLLVAAVGANALSGAVYVYRLSGSTWSPSQSALQPDPDHATGALFGAAIALAGNHAVIGSCGEDSGSGAIYTLERATASAPWTMTRLAAPDPSGGAFGGAVAISSDVLAVGAPAFNGYTGAAYIYRRMNDGWSYETVLFPTSVELAVSDMFGNSLKFSDATLFVSAPGATTESGTAGRIHTFLRKPSWPEGPSITTAANSGFEFGSALAVSPTGAVVTSSVPYVYVYLQDLGGGCASDLDCNSGHCSEGVCCDKACNSGCYSCLGVETKDAGGSLGTCKPVDPGTDPRDSCNTSSEPCGATGTCDGAGRCGIAEIGTLCREAECSSPNEATGSGTCNAGGTCVVPPVHRCEDGYACRSSACVTRCSADRECDEANGFVCFEHACVLGGECTSDADCASKHCSEGVCCDELCDGPCRSCRASRTGADRDGICAAVTQDTNPRGGCDASGPCGNTGQCDGDGACALVPSGTLCSQAICDSATAWIGPGQCDGEGVCELPRPVACACDDRKCESVCNSNGDCDEAHGYYCLEQQCVVGSQCSNETTVIDERGETDCILFRCVKGVCQTSCKRSEDDCAAGAACDPRSGLCVIEAALTSAKTTGGCRLARGGGDSGVDWLVVSVVLMARRRRPRARRDVAPDS